MTESEAEKVTRLTRALNVVLAWDADGANERVRLEPNERAHLDQARMAGRELLATPLERAEKRVELAETHLAKAGQTWFDDGELFGADGQPTEAAEGGKRTEIDREYDEPGLFEDSGETPQAIDWRVPGTSSVPADVQRGIVQALRDGCGKTKACEQVALAADSDVFAVKAHFETLVQLGVVRKDGRGWVADWPEDCTEVNTHAGPNGVVATSETPAGMAL